MSRRNGFSFDVYVFYFCFCSCLSLVCVGLSTFVYLFLFLFRLIKLTFCFFVFVLFVFFINWNLMCIIFVGLNLSFVLFLCFAYPSCLLLKWFLCLFPCFVLLFIFSDSFLIVLFSIRTNTYYCFCEYILILLFVFVKKQYFFLRNN